MKDYISCSVTIYILTHIYQRIRFFYQSTKQNVTSFINYIVKLFLLIIHHSAQYKNEYIQ